MSMKDVYKAAIYQVNEAIKEELREEVNKD